MTEKSEQLARNILNCYRSKLQGNTLLEQINTGATAFSLYCNTSGANRSYFVEMDDGKMVSVDPQNLANALSNPLPLIPALLDSACLAEKAAASRKGSRRSDLPDVWCNIQTEHGAITLTEEDPPFRFRSQFRYASQVKSLSSGRQNLMKLLSLKASPLMNYHCSMPWPRIRTQ